jgi:NAD+--dinitrogen-reductase ADP-D-ribosyltransferase
VILGSLTFQRHPTPLVLDGVEALHRTFFDEVRTLDDRAARVALFKQHMRAVFCLDHPDEAGFQRKANGPRRDRADYLRMLRGWLFDAEGREGAVLKSWVESRFGLLPRSHRGALGDYSGDNYQAYLSARTRGLYNTNALEAQMDLVYSYCQYELALRYGERAHLTLYRGVNHLSDYEVLAKRGGRRWILVLNTLNSFTDDIDRADEFGDRVLRTRVPLAKILYSPDLLPGSLQGEQEYLVVGGVYEVERLR